MKDKLITLLAIIALLAPLGAIAAVTVTDTTLVANDGAQESSQTISYTVASGTDLLVFGYRCFQSTNSPTSVSWNGTSMTLGKDEGSLLLYYLASPDTGTHDFTVSLSTACRAIAVASTLTGVDTSTPIDTTASLANDTATSRALSFTTTQDNTLLYTIGYNNNDTTAVTSDGTTLTGFIGIGGPVQRYFLYATKAAASAGSNSVTFGFGSGDDSLAVGMAINAAAGGGGSTGEEYVNIF